MNNQWQNDLRNRMERHQEPAPEGLWDSIEQIIRAESAAKAPKAMPARRKIPLWAQRVGTVAAAVLILFFIGLFTWKENQTNTQLVEQVQERPHGQPVITARPDKKLFTHNTETEKPASEKPVRADETLTTAFPTYETTTTAEENQPQPPARETTAPEEGNRRQPVDNGEQSPVLENNNTPGFQLLPRRHHRKPAKWQTDLYASNIPSGATREHVGYGSLTPFQFPSEEEEYVVAAAQPDSPGDRVELNEYQHVYTDIKHLQPITLGVSMKYNLDERWSVTSGLTYTILSSQLRSGTGNHYYNSRQTLHYVGIPLNVNYAVWGNDKISTYVSAGGMVEKNVSGTLSTDFVIDNKLETQSRKEISVKQLQWSVNSAVGIQYQVAKNIGIYAEPGVAYHFKNNSDVETIYKEKPLNFNIRLGLRFSLNE
ncbi:outer membrane beta-barrel protein [Petrimonas sp.]|uniref:outer membrane beta-barrel protein n=1 Tax=Petrimonas sp. TaxID=2023866 RepID=UPI003F516BC6